MKDTFTPYISAIKKELGIEPPKKDPAMRSKLFWFCIVMVGYCALVACWDFIEGAWGWGILCTFCVVVNVFNARQAQNIAWRREETKEIIKKIEERLKKNV